MGSEGWFDADAHVIEPASIWTDYTPRALHERVPRFERRGNSDWLVCDGVDLFPIGRLGGLANSERHLRLTEDATAGTWDECIVPGGYDVTARVEAMDVDGVAKALLFPTIAMRFFAIDDDELRWALLRAFNQWMTDFCGASGGRLLGACVVDPDDVDRSLVEVRTARQRGLSAVLVPLLADCGWTYGGEEYDVLWAAAAEHDLPVGFHAFASRSAVPARQGLDLAIDSVVDRSSVVVRAMAQLLFSGTFERIPRLRWFSAENDAGWASYLVERADTLYERAKDHLPIEQRPSELFREHVFITFTHEQAPLATLPLLGADNLMWGSDYPHNVTTWPRSHAQLDATFERLDVCDADRRAVTYDNAARIFR
jgi:predicted TIM-barrel fold metal-dependent hydrolase